MACGYGSPCGYVAPVYSGCYSGCGGWVRERLPDPVQQYEVAPAAYPQQYYYADQGPTYTGPGNLAPYRIYREGGVSGWHAYRHHYRHHYYGYAPHRYGYREHVLRRYY